MIISIVGIAVEVENSFINYFNKDTEWQGNEINRQQAWRHYTIEYYN